MLFLAASESDDAVKIMPFPRASSSRHSEPLKSRAKQKESVRLSPASQPVQPASPKPQPGRHSVSKPKIACNKTINEAENSEEDEEFAELDAWLQSSCVGIL